MANYYKVGANGNAPAYLSVGDLVVTGNGTWRITRVNDAARADYDSVLDNASLHTSNFSGRYATAPSGSSSSSSSGSRTSGSSASSRAQRQAQQSSPASRAWGQTGNTPSYSQAQQWAGQGGSVSNYGEGTLAYDAQTGRITRTMPSGLSFYVNPGDEKYNSIYNEYNSRYGQGQGNSGADIERLLEEARASGSADLERIQQQINDTLAQAQQVTQQPVQTDMAAFARLMASYDEALAKLQGLEYTPVDQSLFTDNIMSLDAARAEAEASIGGQYDRAAESISREIAQQLDRAGIYNSVYGAGLQQNAMLEAEAHKQEAVNALALQLKQSSAEQAMQLFQTAVQESQYAFGAKQSGVSQALNALGNQLQLTLQQAELTNDIELRNRALELEALSLTLNAQFQQAELSAQQYTQALQAASLVLEQIKAEAQAANLNADTAYTNAQLEALKAEAGRGGGGYTGYGGNEDDDTPGWTPSNINAEN